MYLDRGMIGPDRKKLVFYYVSLPSKKLGSLFCQSVCFLCFNQRLLGVLSWKYRKVLDFETAKSTKRLIFSCLFEIVGSTFLKEVMRQMCSPPKSPDLVWSSKRHDQCDSLWLLCLKGWKVLRRGLPRRVGRQRLCRFEMWTRNVEQVYHLGRCGRKWNDQWHRAG